MGVSYVQTYQIVYVKCVFYFFVYQLYYNKAVENTNLGAVVNELCRRNLSTYPLILTQGDHVGGLNAIT